MAQVPAQAALEAAPALSCSTLTLRIRITPGTVSPVGKDVYGPLAVDSCVVVPGITDGIYDSS